MKKTLLTGLQLVLFFAFGFLLLWLLYKNQQQAYLEDCSLKNIPVAQCSLWDKLKNDFSSVNYFWIFLSIICYGFSNLSRAIRWKMLLGSMGYHPTLSNAFFTTIIGYLANLALPRFGEVARAGSIAKYEKIPVEKAIGTIVIDRIADLFMILLITLLGFIVTFDKISALAIKYVNPNERFEEKMGYLTLFLVSLAGLSFLGWKFRKVMRKWTIFDAIRHLFEGFISGVKSISKIPSKTNFLFHTLIIWLMYFLMTYLTLFSFHVTENLTLSAALLVFILGGWGIVVPSPGGMGTYHFMTQIGLAVYGISYEDGFSWANISFFTIQIGGTLLFGAVSFICLPLINRNYKPVILPEK
jgi:uncharacterized protein (TIRG00374 family)